MRGTPAPGACTAEKPGDAAIDTATGDRETEPTRRRGGCEPPPDDHAPAPFAIEPRAMGARSEIDLDDVNDLLERLDGPAYR